MGLRKCDTEAQFVSYVKEKLKTPEKIAAYVSNTVFPEDTKEVLAWLPVSWTLKTKRGNCTEIAGLNCKGLEAIGYEAHHLTIFGLGKDGERHGHAVACFKDTLGHNCYIEGAKVVRDAAPWQTLVQSIRADWVRVDRYDFRDYDGEVVKGFGI